MEWEWPRHSLLCVWAQEAGTRVPSSHSKSLHEADAPPSNPPLAFSNTEPCSPPTGQRSSQQEVAGDRQGRVQSLSGHVGQIGGFKKEELSAVG